MPSLLNLCRAHAREYIDALKHWREIEHDHTLPLRGHFSDAPLGLKKKKMSTTRWRGSDDDSKRILDCR